MINLTLPELNGLLLLDKPAGLTSFDLVRQTRNILKQKAVGHIGTLDPLAVGLMGLLLGQATRLAEYLSGMEKTYLAVVTLGLLTETDDITGPVVSEHSGPYPSGKEIESALNSLAGPIAQVPPTYSAVKVGGQRAYKAARAGRPLDLAPREVRLFDFKLIAYEAPQVTLWVRVSSGFYIRSLARDLGQKLGLSGGAVRELKRESIGPFELSRALKPPFSRDEAEKCLLGPEAVLVAMPRIKVDQAGAGKIRQGRGIYLTEENIPAVCGPKGRYKILGPDERLVAVGRIDSEAEFEPHRPFLRPVRVFKP
ncbi:MAG: tRNA pseudouridine(55) synthase TruB [Deltaproteobacteria bacterium]|nr:tRNA pseudouridine(55) synthase TruB [Deltaproteobacteria bacterium]